MLTRTTAFERGGIHELRKTFREHLSKKPLCSCRNEHEMWLYLGQIAEACLNNYHSLITGFEQIRYHLYPSIDYQVTYFVLGVNRSKRNKEGKGSKKKARKDKKVRKPRKESREGR